jgi:excisionase family DNA binding protein
VAIYRRPQASVHVSTRGLILFCGQVGWPKRTGTREQRGPESGKGNGALTSARGANGVSRYDFTVVAGRSPAKINSAHDRANERFSVAAPRPLSPPLAVRPMEAARLLGVSRSRLYQLLKSGKIPHRKDGAATVIAYEDLVAYLNSLSPVVPDEGPIGPLLLATEPAPEPSAPDLAAEYEKRFKLTVGNVGPDEARLRAFAHTVGECCRHYHVDRETGKKMVSDAIKAARAK